MKIFQKVEVILAIALIVAFFLPWGKMFFFTGSGYDIGIHLDGEARFVWAIPVAAIAIIALAFYDINTKIISIITCLLPFIVVIRDFSMLGKDLFEVMAIGAYSSLVVGALLGLFGMEILKSPSDTQLEKDTT